MYAASRRKLGFMAENRWCLAAKYYGCNYRLRQGKSANSIKLPATEE